jgi:RimJ/RimL family protein N-acetyltransferase
LGRGGLAFAFENLGAEEVVAFTERHNRRSRAVMERLGMRYLCEFPARGLLEGHSGVHDGAPFALYSRAR